jgi:transcription antitermination protein NusB
MSRSRSKARRFAMQALYQWHMTGQDVEDIISQYRSEDDFGKIDIAYFEEILRRVTLRVDEIDTRLQTVLDRPVREVDPVEAAILRMSTYELLAHPDVPFRVVINEAVDLAKVYGAANGYKYVNGILDRLTGELRPAEITQKKTKTKHGREKNASA